MVDFIGNEVLWIVLGVMATAMLLTFLLPAPRCASSIAIELAHLTAERKVRETNQERLRLCLLERESLIALGGSVPSSLIDTIERLSNVLFSDQKPVCPQNIPIND